MLLFNCRFSTKRPTLYEYTLLRSLIGLVGGGIIMEGARIISFFGHACYCVSCYDIQYYASFNHSTLNVLYLLEVVWTNIPAGTAVYYDDKLY